jgi:hypothetical protein
MRATNDNAASLPAELVATLDGRDLDTKVGFTVQLLTVDEDGWPRVALLSVGEVVALSTSTIRIALWPNSHATENLTRTGAGTLAFIHGGVAQTVTVETKRGADLAHPSPRAVFDAHVREHRADAVAYARLTGGIGFELPEPAPVLERWRETVDLLLERGGAA